MPMQTRGELVAEISLQNSVFDENGFLRRLAFVVHVERAAAPGHGAVVDDGAFFAGHALADQAGECRSLLAIEIGFESVADGFVQQHAGPAWAENHFHVSGRSFAGVELQDRLPGSFFGEVFRSLLAEEEVEGDAASATGTPRAELVSVFAMQDTFMRARGWESSAKVPSEPTTRMLRSSST